VVHVTTSAGVRVSQADLESGGSEVDFFAEEVGALAHRFGEEAANLIFEIEFTLAFEGFQNLGSRCLFARELFGGHGVQRGHAGDPRRAYSQ
jgi:hypothetical protein